MANAAYEGLKLAGADVVIKRVPETVPEDVLKRVGAFEKQKEFEQIPICTQDELPEFDGFMLLSPTRFGNMTSQMKSFLDVTGQLWFQKKLVGKPITFCTSTSSQGGGAQTTLTSMYNFAIHHGMIIVPLPYENPSMFDSENPMVCSPYGAATFTGTDGSRQPSEVELTIVKDQAKFLLKIAEKLAKC
ncbi:hypothetical protein RCL1_000776 [Eukaryota sp. TZLM3-RCL]